MPANSFNTVAFDGLDHAYRLAGPADDPTPLVFIHAFPLHQRMWDGQVEALSDRRRVLTYDVRGFGQSKTSATDHFLEFFVDDLDALLEHVGIEQAVLVGCSMGGYIALRLAERDPGRVAGLVLVDSKAAADADEGKRGRAKAVRAVREAGVPAFVEGMLGKLLGETTRTQHPAIVDRVRALAEEASPVGVIGGLIAMATRTDTTAALPRLDIPALVVAGAEDTLIPTPVARAVADALPRGTLVELEGAGHLPNLEIPDAFNAALAGFLNEHFPLQP